MPSRDWQQIAAAVREQGNALLDSWGPLPARAPCPTCQLWWDLAADGRGSCPAHGSYRIKQRWKAGQQ